MNTTPTAIEHMRLSFGRDVPAVTLSDLPAYEEVSHELNPMTIRWRQRVTLETFDARGNSSGRKTFYLTQPGRQDPRGEYNLRVRVPHQGPYGFELEPAGQMRARLAAQGRETR